MPESENMMGLSDTERTIFGDVIVVSHYDERGRMKEYSLETMRPGYFVQAEIFKRASEYNSVWKIKVRIDDEDYGFYLPSSDCSIWDPKTVGKQIPQRDRVDEISRFTLEDWKAKSYKRPGLSGERLL